MLSVLRKQQEDGSVSARNRPGRRQRTRFYHQQSEPQETFLWDLVLNAANTENRKQKINEPKRWSFEKKSTELTKL